MQPQLETQGRDGLCAIWHNSMPLDFPQEEIKPLSLLLSLYDRGQCRVFSLTEGGSILAYAILEIPNQGDVWLLDYLAVTKASRGRGLGSTLLSSLRGVLPDIRALMVEIERIDSAPDSAARDIRERRKRFYLHNGLVETGIYTQADGGIDYEILSLPCQGSVVGGAAAEAMERIYQTIFSPGTYAVHPPVPTCLGLSR